MIEAREVSRTYGKREHLFQALDNVSFTVPTGETAAIIGKSGSGKSTLMHLLGGLDHPTAGEIIIGGRSLGRQSRRAMDSFRSRELGFVFQSFFVEGNQTCYQNVALPLEIGRVPLVQRRQRIDEALDQVGLLDKRDRRAKDLSGGQKQRLAIARAIVNRPQILLADEPTGNLDSATGEKIINLLFGLNKQLGCTLVIVTHDTDLADRCNLRIEISDGRITQVDKPAVKKRSVSAPKTTRKRSRS